MSDMSLEQRVQRWIKPEIRALKAYAVADAAGMIKLDAMENPYGWPESIASDLSQVLAHAAFNRYPDPQASDLKKQLRLHVGLSDRHDILLGNGSDELIQLLILALQGQGRCVLSPVPSFVMYDLVSRMAGMQFIGVPLLPSLQVDLDAMIATIQQHQPALIFLAHPNNPTGQIYLESALIEIIRAAEGLVVIDEAYGPFTRVNALPWLDQFPNVLVLRTFSKMGLAGLRLGYLMGSPAWLHELDKVRLPYNINVLTQISVTFALQHPGVFLEQTQNICVQRAQLIQQLRQIRALHVWDSEANFVLVKCLSSSADEVFQWLKQHKILVKNLHGQHPLLENCLRFSVGAETENKALLTSLRDFFAAGNKPLAE